MERSGYNRGGYSRGRVDRYYEDEQDGGRRGYGGEPDDGYTRSRVGRNYGGELDSGRGGYGGEPIDDYPRGRPDRSYGREQDGGRGGYGGEPGGGYSRGRFDRNYEDAQDVGRGGGYGGEPEGYSRVRVDRNYGDAQFGGRGGYRGEPDEGYTRRRVERSYEDPLDGGNGGYGGGGSGSGYHPRTGGRDRSYAHPYNNRRESGGGEHGGGRRRESGGGGGGASQSYRTPTYHRQSSDRLPDRAGLNREVNREARWSAEEPVQFESRSRSRSRSQVLPPPPARVFDRIQEIPHREVQSIIPHREVQSIIPHREIQSAIPHREVQSIIPHREVQSVPVFMDEGENAYAPIKRPDHGTSSMKTVKLLVNHFPVKFDPSKAILRYDVDIKQDSPSSSRVKKAIPKSDLRLIQEQLCNDNPDKFPLLHTAYDGEKNIFSAIQLPEGTFDVQLHGRSYRCTIKFGTKLGLQKLHDFLKGNSFQIPRDVLQALDVVMKANLFREKVSVGRGLYPREHRKEDDLFNGVAAFRGSQQSLKITSNGLVMCVDYSAVPFRKRMPVFDFLKECIQGIREVNDIARFENQVIRALKGLKVGVNHRRTNQKYTVCGLSEKPTRDISFVLEDLEGKKEPEVIMLTDYFREKWGKEIKHKGMPCLNLGNSKKPNYVPMEFCILAEDKRFPKEQLGKEAARKLKELSLLNPNAREREIHNFVQDEYASGRNGANSIKNFEVEVGMSMTEVDGRVMAPPQLKLGSLSGKTMTTTVDRLKCHWNLLQGKTLVVGKSAERWAVIDFTRDDRRNSLNTNYFIGKLMKRCESIGIQMDEPIMVHQTNMREFSDINKLNRLLKDIIDECRRLDSRRLQMIVCVMAEKHDGYKYLKWVSETQIGVITQCCLSFNANKANDQFLANLGMKINAKLGGSNVELIERFPFFNGSDHFMFIGADVNHPGAMNQNSPSVAAVVGSVNFPAATRYAARVSPQTHRKEEIVNFGSLCLDLVNTYEQRNGVKPNRIVVFRDGVSDGQFDMVLNKEMVDMKKQLYTDTYRPAVTFVVAQKRHTTRLFLNNGRDVGNVPPGTVVDTTIVQPFEFDFYLCSHFGGMGTSKPTHYSVIWDENGFTSDEMQKLIYHLCYIFARCTKPVSLVPPVYYADLVAYRGRMFQEVAAESDSDAGSGASSFDRFFYNLEDHLRDSMFFI